MTTITTSPPRPFWRSYGDFWARTPGSALYLIVVFVLAMVSLSLLASLFWTGVGLILIVVGLPLIVLTLLMARGFGVADRFLLRLTGLPEITEPEWSPDTPGTGEIWRTLTRPIRSPRYWLYLVHGMIVSPILSVITFSVAVTWIGGALGGLSYWFWGIFIPDGDGGGNWGLSVSEFLPWLFGGWATETVEVVLQLIAGLIFAVTLPWVLGGLARAHHAVALGMLGRWQSDDLQAEVRAESAARDAAVRAEAVALRRLERDIHDGPQQRLVRLQMDLAALERRAEAGDSDAAALLARDSLQHAKAALDELRALSSGVAPPLLQDRGLVAALSALAAETAIPVHTELDPAIDTAAGPEIARTIYFVVAELLTNTVKHSGATAVTLKAALRTGTPTMLDVWVVDNGTGGAYLSEGHGLDGLRGRVLGLRGELVVQSPAGGPTSVGAHVPLPGTGVNEPYSGAVSDASLRVVLVEDSVLLREGLVRLFDEAGYVSAGAFGDADDIVARVQAARADVAILDVRLPPSFRDEGIRAALQLRRELPALGILVLSQYVEGVYARELLAGGEGGVGYLLKDRVTSLEEFTDAVRRVHERGTVLDPVVVRQLIASRPDPLSALTPRERDVLELMAEGRSNTTIAERLFIGVGAVEKNVSGIFQKLGLDESSSDHRRVLAVLAFLQRP